MKLINHFEDLEEPNVCEEIAAAKRSVIICANSGCGKTLTIKGVIKAITESQPDSEIHIVDRLNGKGKESGRWMGLEKIAGAVVAPSYDDLTLLTHKIKLIACILENRRKMNVEELNQQHDIWLILEDYGGLYEVGKRILSKDDKDEFNSSTTDLNHIVSDGRELKIRTIVSAYSFMAENIGFSRANIRGFGFFILGLPPLCTFSSIFYGLNQSYIFPNKADREKLKGMYDYAYKISSERNLPAFLTNLGEPRLGLMPDLSWTTKHQLFF